MRVHCTAALKDLARRLTAEYGSGYYENNLRYMCLFYLAFPICDVLRHELSWTHYRSLTRFSNPIALSPVQLMGLFKSSGDQV